MPRTASDLPAAERAFLLHLQTLALRYFLDNQTPAGLVLDRQRNFGPRRAHGWGSTAAPGMGLIALALASAEPFRLLTPAAAADRVRRGLRAALDGLPHTHGILPHFTDAATGATVGADVRSTVDSAWLVAGGLWAAAFLGDAGLQDLAGGALRPPHRRALAHPPPPPGPRPHRRRPLPCGWDRLNGETVFLYVLAAGADDARAWPAASWSRLRPFFGTVAGLRFNNADLGLFVFQYGLDLLDLGAWREPGGLDLA